MRANAVLAFAREGYTNWDDQAGRAIRDAGLLGLPEDGGEALEDGKDEMWRSVSKRAFVRALQRLVPEIRQEHLHKAPAGVRAKP